MKKKAKKSCQTLFLYFGCTNNILVNEPQPGVGHKHSCCSLTYFIPDGSRTIARFL